MLRITLTDEQRETLEQTTQQAIGRVALRAQIILLLARGYSAEQIAGIQGCGIDVVRNWIRRYQQEGIAGLDDRPRSGRPLKDPLEAGIIEAQASQSPPCSGHVQTCWSVRLLGAFLAQRFQLRLSAESLRRWLHRLGWRWARPRLVPARTRDPEYAAKVACLTQAREQAASQQVQLVYFDESDLQLLPILRAMWMRGPRVDVPTPGNNQRHTVFGALEALTGRWFSHDHPRKSALHFVAFLEDVALALAAGPALVFVFDNAPIHTAKVVHRWIAAHPAVHVLWLPTYSGHRFNPVERIWGLLKAAMAANRLAGSMSFLVREARRFLTDLPRYPVHLPAVA